MPIDYSKVNIAIGQFQALSSGEHNAGEVLLVDENTIDKVNNFVFRKHKNTVSLAQEEVLAIKNAFVKSLSDSGVNGDELNKVRKELGLASANPADSRLHARSIKPLTRQQIRVILDRNAAAINQKLGEGTIRTSGEIYNGVGDETSKTRCRLRNEANAELPWRRNVDENAQVSLLRKVLKTFVSESLDLYIEAEEKGMEDKYPRAIGGACMEAKIEELMNFKCTYFLESGPAALHDTKMPLQDCMSKEIQLLIQDEEDDAKKTWSHVAGDVKKKLVGQVRPIYTAKVTRDEGGDITNVKYEPVRDINDQPVVRKVEAEDLDEIGEAVMATVVLGA